MPTISDIDKIIIRNESRQIQDVIRRIDNATYIMDPDFQRDFVWSRVQQSKLIESVLMRIPLPVFYLLEKTDGRIMIVDGLQRLTTFHRFKHEKLELDLKDNFELNGKRFSDLTMKLSERFNECNLTVYIIDPSVSEERCYDIFERVNSGVPLTRQQMRNCLCSGLGTKFLRNESLTSEFSDATGNSLSAKKMQDREYVNRFCAFRIRGIDGYKQCSNTNRMDQFLSECLKEMNGWTNDQLQALSQAFRCSLRINYELFGAHSFRKSFLKHESVTKSPRNRSGLIAPLWDVMVTCMSYYTYDSACQKLETLRQGYRQLMNDSRFLNAIDNFSHTTGPTEIRFQMTRDMLHGILGSQDLIT